MTLERFLFWVVSIQVVWSMLAGLLFAGFAVWGHRVSASTRYAIWLSLTAVLWSTVLTLFFARLLPVHLADISFVETVLTPVFESPVFTASAHAPAVGAAVFDWCRLLLSVWIVGTLWSIGRAWMRYLQLLSYLKRWRAAPSAETMRVRDQICAALTIKRDIPVWVVSGLYAPFLAGCFSPAIFLPDTTEDENLYLLLKHELMHAHRHDLWRKLFLMVTAQIFWFNPVVHFVVKRTTMECELSCDELVLAAEDSEQAYVYGKILLQTMRSFYTHKERANGALGFVMKGDFAYMKTRLHALSISGKKSPKWVPLLIAMTSCFVLWGTGLGVAAAVPRSFVKVLPTADLHYDAPASAIVSTESATTIELTYPVANASSATISADSTTLSIYAEEGSEVVAAQSGTVLEAPDDNWGGQIGYYIQIQLGGGMVATYSHLDKRLVKAGDMVQAGQVIGTVGTSGLAERGKPLCGFGLEKDGRPIDLTPVLR